MPLGWASICEWLFDKLPFFIELAFFLLLPLLLYRYAAYIVGENVLRALIERALLALARRVRRRDEAAGGDSDDESPAGPDENAETRGGLTPRAQADDPARQAGLVHAAAQDVIPETQDGQTMQRGQADIPAAQQSAAHVSELDDITYGRHAMTPPRRHADSLAALPKSQSIPPKTQPTPFSLPPRRRHTAHLKPPMTRAQWAQVALWVLVALVASRLLVLAAGQLGQAWRGDGGFFDIRLDRYIRWDAFHYIRLARDWYVNEGDPRFHIVFFPLYPLALRAVNALIPMDTGRLGIILSNIFLYLGGLTLYELVRVTYGRKAAIRSVWLFMLSPLTVFMSIPYGESLFVLMTLLSVLMARKRRFLWAVVFGALAANTRMLGILTAAPIFLELMDAGMEMPLEPRERLRDTIGRVLMASLVLVGLGAYLVLNWQVTGNPFQFLIYQREHWSQQFGSIRNTMSYSMDLARARLAEDDSWYAYTTWIPQVASVALLTVLLYVVRRRLHPGDGAYAWLYVWAAIAPTWLLSGSRYLMALYALYPAVALIGRSRRWFAAMLTVFVVLLCYFSALYMGVGLVL